MKIVDITIDFETLSLKPNAAAVSMAAVAWDESKATLGLLEKPDDLFIKDENGNRMEFSAHFNVLEMICAGFTVDPETCAWWSRQSEEAKAALCEGTSSEMLEVMLGFRNYIEEVKRCADADQVRLWSQGTDFDLPLLKNILTSCRVPIPLSHQRFRDHRSLILEYVPMLFSGEKRELLRENTAEVYKVIEELGAPLSEAIGEYSSQAVHDPLYDCYRSIWNTAMAIMLLDATTEHRQ